MSENVVSWWKKEREKRVAGELVSENVVNRGKRRGAGGKRTEKREEVLVSWWKKDRERRW